MPTNPFQADTDRLTEDAQYAPTTGTFDESRGAAGRVDSIIAADSPLMQRAQTKALQGMNSRGLRNSSIAVGAAQNAVLDAATPLAQTDAGLFSNQAIENQRSLNTAAQANARMRGEVGMEGMRLGENARQFDTGEAGLNTRFDREQSAIADRFGRELSENTRQFDTREAGQNTRFATEQAGLADRFATEQAGVNTRFASGQAHDINMAALDLDSRTQLLQMESEHRSEIANNENISNAWATTTQQISAIQNNPDLDEATKKTLINNVAGGFNSFATFWSRSSGVDVSDLLDLGIDDSPPAGEPAGAPTEPYRGYYDPANDR